MESRESRSISRVSCGICAARASNAAVCRSRTRDVVAAHGPRALAIAGRYGDGWYPTLKMTAEVPKEAGIVVKAGIESGRSMDRFEASDRSLDAGFKPARSP